VREVNEELLADSDSTLEANNHGSSSGESVINNDNRNSKIVLVVKIFVRKPCIVFIV
jgi:hypothetical protein